MKLEFKYDKSEKYLENSISLWVFFLSFFYIIFLGAFGLIDAKFTWIYIGILILINFIAPIRIRRVK